MTARSKMSEHAKNCDMILVEELEKIKSILIIFAVERSLEWVKKFLFHINMLMIK